MLVGYSQREPDSINAGTTLLWQRHLHQYPASQGWSLQYSLIGLGAQITFTSVPDGDSHTITVPAAITSAWLPTDGAKLSGYAINAGPPVQQFAIYYQTCPVRPNLVNPPENQPSKTFNERVIEMLENLYLTKSNDDLVKVHVGDQAFQFETKREIWDALQLARIARKTEIDIERAKNRKPSRRRIIPVISITPPGPIFGSQYPGGYLGGS
jgi:hypothetical protein